MEARRVLWRFLVRVLAGLAILVLLAPGALADTRVALVIGNSSYAHGGRLPNPVNDAAAVAEALRKVGFTVTSRQDMGKVEFEQTLKTFTRDAAGADVAVVYYAGHGMEMGGTNYLIPVDATLAADSDVDFETVPLDLVMRSVDGAKRIKVVILDACRNNPFADAMKRTTGASRSIGRGFAKVEPQGDMLVAYAAEAGSTAEDGDTPNSPFATALTHRLVAPGVEIRILFGQVRDDVLSETGQRQRPAIYGSLGGEGFYFVPPAGSAVAVAVAPTPGATAGGGLDPRAIELAYWQSVSASSDPVQLNDYLRRYPAGAFADIAHAKLAALTAAAKNQQLAKAEPPPVLRTTSVSPNAAAEAVINGDRALKLKDYVQAMRWYRQAADAGLAVGQFDVGRLYADGLGVPVDFVEAMKWLRLASLQGNVAAQTAIGHFYEDGHGVPVDYAEAMRWFRLGARINFPAAQNSIGFLYEKGLGVSSDLAESMRWYRLAADQGFPAAQNNVGRLYRAGLGVPVDFIQAMRWYRLAADQGFGPAQFNLAVLYADGLGAPKDEAIARQWMTKAADGGIDRAKAWLAKHPG
jgi:TPR repeat protein